ncbi:alpha-2-macroglobulin 1 [Pelobates cultripes]|uniref:Alpha-2-macroglobulin 1 n=1 Tax=Pelobates cultripes TaxID=61616 RepID=A0AAD1TBT0_PELCU|nr:alpha-2-macroglobulin 1 [Pelobates cultripes]
MPPKHSSHSVLTDIPHMTSPEEGKRELGLKLKSTGSVETELKVPDSITEWNGQMFCTKDGNFALSKPTALNVFKPYFVEMTLPYSIKRGETFVLKANLYNYMQECIQTEVTLLLSEDLHLNGTDKNIHNTCLCAGEKKTISWPVTITSTGHKNITVSSQAVGSKDTCGGQETMFLQKGQKDTVINSLLVEPEGTLVEQTHNSLLICYGSSVEEKVKLDLPETYVEGSAKASINVFGDLMSSALNNLDNLLAMSCGCGEQNMVRFAPNVYIMQYLDSSQQLSEEMRKKGNDFLTKGYQRQLTYKHKTGCYSAFGESDKEGNTWLTAFVLKSFTQAQKFMFIDEEHVNNGIKWLEKQQRSDGCFKATGRLLNNALKGGVDDEVSLTSYVLAALMESGMSPDNPMVDRGMQCLKNAYQEEASTYKMALMAYAYTLADLPDARAEILQKLDSRAIKAESQEFMTNIVQMASAKQVSTKELGEMVAIMRWLSKQQNAKGGFSSTQDTVVALQALAKFGLQTFSKDGNVTVTVSSENGFQHKLHVDDSNRLILQRTSLPQIPGEYTITATGMGSVYIQIQETSINRDSRYKGERPSTNMVLVDKRSTIRKDLKKKSTVKRVETNEDSAIIYIEELLNLSLHIRDISKLLTNKVLHMRSLKKAQNQPSSASHTAQVASVGSLHVPHAGDSQRPTYSYQGADQGTDPEGPDPPLDPSTPLTIGSLRDMLKEATVDIKSHVAEEISRNLAGLRAEIQTLTARTDQTELLNPTPLMGYRGRDRSRDRATSPHPAKQKRPPHAIEDNTAARRQGEQSPPHRSGR